MLKAITAAEGSCKVGIQATLGAWVPVHRRIEDNFAGCTCDLHRLFTRFAQSLCCRQPRKCDAQAETFVAPKAKISGTAIMNEIEIVFRDLTTRQQIF